MEAKCWCQQKSFAENPSRSPLGQSLLGESNYSNHFPTHMRKIYRSDKFPTWEVDYGRKEEGQSIVAQPSCYSSASMHHCPILVPLLQVIMASQDKRLRDEKSSVMNDEHNVPIHTCQIIYGKAMQLRGISADNSHTVPSQELCIYETRGEEHGGTDRATLPTGCLFPALHVM